MFVITAKCVVKPEKRKEFIECAKELILKSNQEIGCVYYDLHTQDTNENLLTFVELWKDKEAIELHNNSEHFLNIVPKLGEFQEKDIEVSIYEGINNISI